MEFVETKWLRSGQALGWKEEARVCVRRNDQ